MEALPRRRATLITHHDSRQLGDGCLVHAGRRHGEEPSCVAQVIENGAVVPIHWPIEVGNALLVAMRGRRISSEKRRDALAQLIGLTITLDGQTADEAWGIPSIWRTGFA